MKTKSFISKDKLKLLPPAAVRHLTILECACTALWWSAYEEANNPEMSSGASEAAFEILSRIIKQPILLGSGSEPKRINKSLFQPLSLNLNAIEQDIYKTALSNAQAEIHRAWTYTAD